MAARMEAALSAPSAGKELVSPHTPGTPGPKGTGQRPGEPICHLSTALAVQLEQRLTSGARNSLVSPERAKKSRLKL